MWFSSHSRLIDMATHECSACLQETIQGASEVVGILVLPISSCPASGGVHTWMRKTSTTGYYYFNSLHVLIYLYTLS